MIGLTHISPESQRAPDGSGRVPGSECEGAWPANYTGPAWFHQQSVTLCNGKQRNLSKFTMDQEFSRDKLRQEAFDRGEDVAEFREAVWSR